MNDELANPFRKRSSEGEAPRRPPGGTPRELTRLYIMALVFLMSVATMVYMWKAAVAAPRKPQKAGVGVTVRPDGTREGAPDGQAPQAKAPLPPVKKDVPLQELPKDGLVDFKKLAEPFRDGLEPPVKETPEFVALLRTMLTAATPEMLAKRVNPELNAEKAYHDTQRARGEVVRVYGRLVKIYTEPLDTTIPENVTHVPLGIMMEYPSNRTVWFYLPEKPKDAQGAPMRFKTYSKRGEEFFEDWIELDGVVLRRFDYPSQYETDKEETAWARSVVLFGRGVRLASKPQMTGTQTGFVTVVVLLTVVIVAIVLTAGVMTRRYGGGDASLRMAVTAAKREKAKQKGESIFAAPDPAKQVLGAEVAKTAEGPPTSDAAPPPPAP
jgi:hypothetical protein